MAILRVLGGWILALAALALINDVARSVWSGSKLAFLSLGGHWNALHEASFKGAQAFITRSLHPLLWDPLLLGVLRLPAWLTFGLVGLALCWIGRRRRRIDLYSN